MTPAQIARLERHADQLEHVERDIGRHSGLLAGDLRALLREHDELHRACERVREALIPLLSDVYDDVHRALGVQL